MKKCVFTCITGTYDVLNDIKKEEGFEYICFTNNRLLTSNTWQIVYVEDTLDNSILQRKVKILSYRYLPEYDLTIYIDAPITVKSSLNRFLMQECELERYDMICFKHQERDCVYDEITICSNLNKDDSFRLSAIKEFLLSQNYPKHNGLTENTVLVRKNTKAVNQLMDDWFSMILNYSRRDQLSFNYCLWKKQIKIKVLDMYVYDNAYFKHNGHQGFDFFRYVIGFDEDCSDLQNVQHGEKILILFCCFAGIKQDVASKRHLSIIELQLFSSLVL